MNHSDLLQCCTTREVLFGTLFPDVSIEFHVSIHHYTEEYIIERGEEDEQERFIEKATISRLRAYVGVCSQDRVLCKGRLLSPYDLAEGSVSIICSTVYAVLYMTAYSPERLVSSQGQSVPHITTGKHFSKRSSNDLSHRESGKLWH